MRLLLLLAWVVGVFGDLQSYTPARGEFPVQSRLAQGYIRYVDNNGAERLLAYAYPEPLYGVRRLSYGAYDRVNPLLKTNIEAGGLRDHNDDYYEWQDQFRSWCEQRYQALKREVQRLRSEGKNAGPRIADQLTSLQNVLDPHAPETPMLKQAREEQLRIWNEERLKVLQLQTEHLKHQALEPLGIRPVISSVEGLKTYAATAPQNRLVLVEETPEQKKAREEHLRIYNDQLQRLQRLESGADIETSQAPAQKVTEYIAETPEVARAKEEHIRLWNEAKTRAENNNAAQPIIGVLAVKAVIAKPLQQVLPSPQSLPAQVMDTAEVIRAREEHLKLFSEANRKATQYQQQQLLKVAEEEAIQNRGEEGERQREIERRREEEHRMETEREQETTRQKEEQRLMEVERLRLQVEDQLRRENDRLTLLKSLRKEDVNMKDVETVLPAIRADTDDGQLLLRITTQPGSISGTGTYLTGNEQPLLPNHVVYKYAPALGYAGLANSQNPFLLRYAQAPQNIGRPAQTPNDRFEAGPILPTSAIQQPQPALDDLQLKAAMPTDSIIVSEPQPQMQTQPYDEAASLAALEKATREHFRAHEVALEQLRLANLRDSKAKDC